MTAPTSPEIELRAKIAELHAQLGEAEDALRAIRGAEVEALIVETDHSPQIFALPGLDAESNRVRGEILARISDAVIAVDAEQCVTYMNAAAESQYGVVAAMTLGCKLTDLYEFRWLRTEDEVEAMTALRERGEWRGENIHITRAGREVHVESTVTVSHADDGSTTGMIAVIRDITHRKQAEAALEESEHFLQRITAVVPGVLHVFDLEQQHIVFANRTVAAVLGYTPEEIDEMGDTVVPTLMHPDDLVPFAVHLDRVRALPDREVAEFEHRMRDRTGKWHWFHSRDAVFSRDATGAASQVIGTAIEITARKQAEGDRVDAIRRFEFALQSAPVTLFVQDSDLLYTWIYNPAFGYNSEYVIGKRDADLFERAEDAATVEAIKLGVMRTGVSERGDVLIHADGVDRYYDLLVEPLVGDGGSITGVICAAIDITERNRSAVEAQRVGALLDTLLQTAPVGFCFLDRDLRFVRINDRLAAMNGMSAEAHLGRHVSEVVPTLFESLRDVTSRVLETGDAVKDHEFSGETPAAPGVRRLWNESWYPVRDGAGEIMGFGAIIEDITARKQVEQARRESELRMRLATEATSVGIWEWNVHTGEIRWDAVMFQIHGIAPTADGVLHYRDFAAAVLPEDFPEQDKILQDTARRAGSSRRNFRIRRRSDGECRYIEAVETARTNDNGETDWVVGTNLDVTDRERLLRQVEGERERLADVFRQAPAFMCVLRGVDHVFELANDAYYQLVDHRDLLGRPVRDAFPEVVEQDFIRLLDGVYRTGTPFVGTDVRLLLGQMLDERFVDFVYQALRDPDGTVTGVLVVGVDVTARHAAAATLRKNEARYRAASAAVSDVIWTNSADGMMESEQPGWEDFTGQSSEEYQGHGWLNAVHPEDVPATLETWARAVAEKRAFVFEHRVRHCDGEWRVCSVRAVPVLDADGLISEWVGVHADITVQRRSDEALRQLAAELSDSDRRKDEFLATLAHELRNPLAPIRNGLHLMKLAGEQDVAFEQTRSMMERQLTQMVRLVDDLMDVSRISRGQLELRREQVPLAAVLHSALETSRLLIEHMGHKITVTVPTQPIIVDADMTRLPQVFMNLLNNAAKYSDAGGHIQLDVEQHGSEVSVRVTDTGIGIAADQLPGIFEMFTQVKPSLEKSQGGLGIGLALAKCLVEMHGGRIDARSDGLGHGSEFVVRLPVVVEASTKESPSGDEAMLAKTSLRILVVDDNRDGADSLAMMLTIMGNDTRTAYDGQEGVDVAAEFRPDVIVFDIGLPKLNGYDACRRIREQLWAKSVVLIAVTGWGQEEDRRRARDAGFNHHVVKPVDARTLMTLLAGVHGEAP